MNSVASQTSKNTLILSLSRFFIFGFIVLATLSLNRQLTNSVNRQYDRVSRDDRSAASFRWHPDLFRILSFGQVPASVDWLLIRFLTDGNIAKIRDGKETEASRILNLATDVDPSFFMLYTTGTNFLAVVRNDIYGAKKLIDKGAVFLHEKLPQYPKSFQETEWGAAWRLLMVQGYVYLLELQDIEGAAKAYRELERYPDTPDGMKSLAKSIGTTEGQFRIALNSIFLVKRWYESDLTMTEELKKKEALLKLGQALYLWNRDFEAFKERRHESIESRFSRFRIDHGIPDRDFAGGRIFLNAKGRIDSDTPRQAVFGIAF